MLQASLDVDPPAVALPPVELLLERDHAYKRKTCSRCERPKSHPSHRKPENGGTCVFGARPGCAVCGLAMYHGDHMGGPPSLRDAGSGMDHRAYQGLKHAWQEALTTELQEARLPLGLQSVMVEGLIGFPDLAERDQGNFRWLVEKALGDALQAGGWIESDCFYPVSRYEFGGLQAEHTPGRSLLRLMLFARLRPAAG